MDDIFFCQQWPRAPYVVRKQRERYVCCKTHIVAHRHDHCPERKCLQMISLQCKNLPPRVIRTTLHPLRSQFHVGACPMSYQSSSNFTLLWLCPAPLHRRFVSLKSTMVSQIFVQVSRSWCSVFQGIHNHTHTELDLMVVAIVPNRWGQSITYHIASWNHEMRYQIQREKKTMLQFFS